jgi:hypothetical protein
MATITVKIYVSDLANVMSLYDVIQVQRTVTTPPAVTPEDLTADVAEPAELVGTLEGPYAINGRVLSFKVNGTLIDVTFTSPDPVAIPDVVDEVNAALTLASLPATASNDSGKLKLETDDNGTQFTLEIVSGGALSELGFTVGQKSNGKASHTTLQVGVDSYDFVDGSGAASYYYRTRYFNTANDTFSAWSDWIQGTTAAAVDPAQLIIAKVFLSELDGTAQANAKIVITNVFVPSKADGYGIFGLAIELETDLTGYAEATLVKGSTVDVIFAGTSIVRRIEVPDVGTEFDLLDDTLVVGDQFEIQVPDIPYAPRRS